MTRSSQAAASAAPRPGALSGAVSAAPQLSRRRFGSSTTSGRDSETR
ncbi:hypothetical protein [Corynebacterium senegalense]|nr:hypothetical protein [Corynebacterium senegalense]